MSLNRLLVIGGGVIGITTAYELVKRGHEVTLLESLEDVALETSYATGALQVASMSDPWNSPGVYTQLAKSLFNPNSAVKLRLYAIPSLLSWGIRFLHHSSVKRHWLSTEANYRLAQLSIRRTQQVRNELDLRYDSADRGVLYIFRDREQFNGAIALRRRLHVLGLRYKVLDVREAVTKEPLLESIRSQLVGALYFPDDCVGDTYTFSRQLVSHMQRLGGTVKTGTTVHRICHKSGVVTGVETNQGEIAADRIIVAAGNKSPALLRPMNLSLAIKPAKGYTVTFSLDAIREKPVIPLVDDGMHTVIVPIGNRLRIAGTAEFTGFDTRLSPERINNLHRVFEIILPGLFNQVDLSTAESWTGLRPMSADGRPFIGPTHVEGLFVNSGHGHLGWTMAMGSACILADQLEQKTPEIPYQFFAPSR